MKARKKMEDEYKDVDDFLGRNGFTKILVGVAFDSKNAMGTLLRSSGYCKWVKPGRGSDITWDHFDADEAGVFLLSK